MQHQRVIVKKKVTEGTNPLRLLPAVAATSPEGRGSGEEKKLLVFAKGSPFGRAVTVGD